MEMNVHIDGKEILTQIASAGAIIRNREKEFLFEIKPQSYKKNPGGITLFGGRAEIEDATPIDTLKRELMEELGVNLDEQKVKPIPLGYESSHSKENAYNARYFVDNLDDTHIVLSEESAGILKIKDLTELEHESYSTGNGVDFATLAFINEFQKTKHEEI